MVTAPTRPEVVGETRVVLRGITWATYERLLAETGDAGPRLTYDHGTLEIMSPTPRHEKLSRRLSSLVEAVADVWAIDLENFGSATLRRPGAARGAEPDASFYISRLPAVAGRDEIDIGGGDPAPDLVIEVDLTNPSVDKLPLYAELGVNEVWRLADGALEILTLENGAYTLAATSVAFPTLTAETLNALMAQGRLSGRAAWLRTVQDWARANRPETSSGNPE